MNPGNLFKCVDDTSIYYVNKPMMTLAIGRLTRSEGGPVLSSNPDIDQVTSDPLTRFLAMMTTFDIHPLLIVQLHEFNEAQHSEAMGDMQTVIYVGPDLHLVQLGPSCEEI